MSERYPAENTLIYRRDGGDPAAGIPARCVIPVRVTEAVWEQCRQPAASTHHRNHRHTDNRPSNRLSACGSGTTGHHGLAEAHPELAYAMGWSFRHEGIAVDPAQRPVFLWHPFWGLGWYLLDDDRDAPGLNRVQVRAEPGPGGQPVLYVEGDDGEG